MNKVFVGNLSFDTSREQLEALFSPIGELTDVFVPLDRASGRPRGFAFVTFASGESAAEAIAKLDGVELQGRNLRVNEATAEGNRGPAGAGHGRSFAGAGAAAGRGPGSRPKGSRRNIRGRKRSIW